MTLTVEDLKDKLKQVDEVSLLEILDVDSEDLVDWFHELIVDRYDILVKEFEEEEDD